MLVAGQLATIALTPSDDDVVAGADVTVTTVRTDANGNGVLDTGEDTNGNGVLDVTTQ